MRLFHSLCNFFEEIRKCLFHRQQCILEENLSFLGKVLEARASQEYSQQLITTSFEIMNLLDFSDEVLIFIFSFLKTEDVISLTQTCKRLDSILCDRQVIGKTNLNRATSLNRKTLHEFMRPSLRRHNIHTLNLTDCYWLSSSDIYASSNLPNLTCLYVKNTQLNFKHLFWILQQNNMITHLSWSFNMFEEMQPISPSMSLENQISLIDCLRGKLKVLEYLNLNVQSKSINQLHFFLTYCVNLKELRLSLQNSAISSGNIADNGDMLMKFYSLHSLVIELSAPNNAWIPFVSLILSSCKKSNEWKIFWIDKHFYRSSEMFGIDYRIGVPKVTNTIEGISTPLKINEVEEILNSEHLRYFDCLNLKFNVRKKLQLVSLSLSNSYVTHLCWGSAQLLQMPSGLVHLYVGSNYCECIQRRHTKLKLFDSMPNLHSLSIPFCAFAESPNNKYECRLREMQTEKEQNQCDLIICEIHSSPTRASLSQLNTLKEQRLIRKNGNHDLKKSSAKGYALSTTAQEKYKLRSEVITQYLETFSNSCQLCDECEMKLSSSNDITNNFKTSQFDESHPSSSSEKNNAMFNELFNADSSDSNESNSEMEYDESISKQIHKIIIEGEDKQERFQVNYLYPKSKDDNHLCNRKLNVKVNKKSSEPIIANNLSPLANFVKHTQNLKRLELRNCDSLCNQRCSLQDLASVFCITHWTKLEYLSLQQFPIIDSRVLIQIAKSCPRIQHLSLLLNEVCHSPNLIKDLTQSILLLEDLQDLRLEYHQSGQLIGLLQALHSCTKLQRIVIVNDSIDEPPLVRDIFTLIEECKKIVFLYFKIVSFSQETVDDFKQEIYTRFSNHRPALWAYISRDKNVSRKIFPDVHYREMISHDPHLKIVPTSQE